MPSETLPEISEYEQLSPLLAAVQGKEEEEQWFLFASFSALPENIRELLTSPSTVDQIKQWSVDGLFPSSHMVAVAKIIGLTVLDDEIPLTSVHTLLERIGLTPEQSSHTELVITRLLNPVVVYRTQTVVEPEMAATEMPPMTRPTENGPRVLSPQAPTRNIIDLRKQRPTDA